MNKQEFKKRSEIIHNNKYDYSKVDYKSGNIKVIIICPIHGEFKQTPESHYRSECPKCNNNNVKYSIEIFIRKANKIHNNKYDYSKIKYCNIKTKICIICPIHGEFLQIPKHHIRGSGCPKCAVNERKKKKTVNVEYYINKFKELYGNLYDYSKVNYVNSRTNICVICPIHGDFYVSPNNHLSRRSGCPKCNSSKGEIRIEETLKNNKIKFEKQKSFNDCKCHKKLFFDFFLPQHRLLIEYDGEQHYKEIGFFGGRKGFEERRKRDEIKNNYVKKNNLRLIRIKYNDNINEKLEGIMNDKI
jgi:very-short-patch-repair endonuclease